MSRARMFVGRLVAAVGLMISVVGIWIALGYDEADVYAKHIGDALKRPPTPAPK